MPGYAIPTGRAELEQRVLTCARADPEFRDRLLADPRTALCELLCVELPERLEIRVVQERPDSLCIVLPVDLSGLGHDAVWAMIGRRPDGEAPRSAARVP
jgi:hypothetical protein